MALISSTFIDNLFSTINSQSSQLDNLSNKALERGIDLYMKGNYDEAVKEFKRSVGLSPYSENSLQTFEFIADAYLKQGKTEEAVSAYKQSIKLSPSNDSFHLNLGNLYYRNERYQEALEEYKMAVRINPNSSVNRYALGQAYLTTGHYSEAESQFKRVIQLLPNDPNAYDALGQVYRKLGKYEDAVFQFNKALVLKKDFPDTLLNLGYTYADMGELDKAQQQADTLKGIDAAMAFTLSNYINTVTQPRMLSTYTFGGFTPTSGRKTLVSSMDSSLSNPEASKVFTMRFIFSKEMDALSVQNPYNWQISRASGKDIGGAYNWGLAIPATEVNISPLPTSVTYNKDTHAAEVSFRIVQNSSANGTLDPSHIVFKFYGKDASGNKMDPKADEYSGISKIV